MTGTQRRSPEGDLVQLFLHVRGEADVHNVGEVLDQQVVDRDAQLGGQELLLFFTT